MAPPRVGAGSTATAVQVRKDEPTRPVFGTTPQQKAHTPWTAKNGPRKIGSPPPPTEQPPEEKSTSQGLVQQHPTATKPVVTSTWWSTLNAAADRLGASLQSAGKTIASASAGLGAASWLGLEARALGAATELLGKGVANAPEGAVVASDAIHGAATDLYARGEKLVAESQRLGRHGVQLAADGVQGLENGVAAIGTAAREYASIISKATDYRTNIDKLGEGDSYTLGLDGWAGIEGVRALANGNIEVSRNASGYTVSEEAQRAASILLKQAGTLAAGALVPLPGSTLAAQAIAGPSREDLEFLGKNISAVEFSGNACAEVFGILGVKNAAGLLGVANVTAQQAVRIETPPDGPAKLVTRQKLSGEVASHAGLFSEGKKGDGWVNVAGGEASAEVMLTRSFDLPPGVNLEALRSEPGKTLKVVAGAMQKTAAESVTMGFDATGGVLGNGAGVAGELVVTGKIDDLARSGTIGKALAGDMKGAVAALPGSTTVDASLKRYSNIGVKVGPMISVMGFGAGIEFAARRRDADPSRAREFSKPAKEAAADLSAWLAASAKRA